MDNDRNGVVGNRNGNEIPLIRHETPGRHAHLSRFAFHGLYARTRTPALDINLLAGMMAHIFFRKDLSKWLDRCGADDGKPSLGTLAPGAQSQKNQGGDDPAKDSIQIHFLSESSGQIIFRPAVLGVREDFLGRPVLQ